MSRHHLVNRQSAVDFQFSHSVKWCRTGCILIILCGFTSLFVVGFCYWVAKPNGVATESASTLLVPPVGSSITLSLVWEASDGRRETHVFDAVAYDMQKGRGLWLSFDTDQGGEHEYAVIDTVGSTQRLEVSLSKMRSLKLRIALGTENTNPREHVIFDRLDSNAVNFVGLNDVFHVFVHTNVMDEQATKDSPVTLLPAERGSNPAFARTHQIATSYMIQSDAQSAKFAPLFGVVPHYEQPRIVVVSEKTIAETNEPLIEQAIVGAELKIEMVRIPAGGEYCSVGQRDEPKQIRIERPYWIGKYEVTQEQWTSIMGSNPSHFRGKQHPVDQVTWDECQEFLKRLNARVGGPRFVLPTTAQWEYARRGAQEEPFSFSDDEAEWVRHAWYAVNAGDGHRPVGQLEPNRIGLHDMHGNVHEWTASPGDREFEDGELLGAETKTDIRQICGSAWIDVAPRSSGMAGTSPTTRRDFTFGFRLARECEAPIALTSDDFVPLFTEEMTNGEQMVSLESTTLRKEFAIDVLCNDIKATGQFARGFQAARSAWNDILEGKVIYEADDLRRQVLTASIVFSQMQENIATRNSKNRLRLVSSANHEVLGIESSLDSNLKQQIRRFLDQTDGSWQALIPQQAVMFYDGDQPCDEAFAWFQVQPSTGRMIGMLSNGSHGGRTAGRGGNLERLRDNLPGQNDNPALPSSAADTGGGGFFQQLAGMMVAEAGIIDGVAEVMSDSAHASSSSEKMMEFLSTHALDHAQAYLEQHAALYGSNAARAAFWQGAVVLPLALGGREALEKAKEHALNSADFGTLGNEMRDWLNGL